MLEHKPTWVKSIIIFLGIFIVLIAILWGGPSGSDDVIEDSFSETRKAVDAIINNSFTASGVSVIPPIDPNADWLNDSQDDPFLGPEDAKIVIMEFSDFQCPFCGESFPTIRQITSQYPEIKYIYRDWPVEDVHPEARKASEAANCAHDQGKFWAYHDRLFQNQHSLTNSNLITYARQTGIEMQEFTECFNEGKFANEVEQDRLIGISLGVRGTPTWFINGEKVEGVIPQDGWDKLLEAL